MGNIDISVGVQLWQIVFSAFLCLGSVAGMSFAAAITFVRRSECVRHGAKTDEKFDELVSLVMKIKKDVGELKGRSEK